MLKHKMGPGYCMGCKGDCKFADGGEVKGVHESVYNYPQDKADEGRSKAGHESFMGRNEKSKDIHKEKLDELKSMPSPKLKGLADGGEVDEESPDMPDDSGSDELLDQCCDELLKAIETKNKSEILESLKAIILSVKG